MMWVNLKMSFLDQMKLPVLIDLSFIFILASFSKGQGWNIIVTRRIKATMGSDVTINCTFTYPLKQHTENLQVYWKKPVPSAFNTFDNDRNAYVSHPNETFVLPEYRGKTKLIGKKYEKPIKEKAKGDCSLVIFNIMENIPNIYVRVIAKGDNYSFRTDSVAIYMSGPGVTPVTLGPDIITQPLPTNETTTVGTPLETPVWMYCAIFVPVAALLIIIFVVGIAFYIKHKRSQSFTREESGYYANFSRESSHPAKREACCKKQENKTFSELKVIDEPVYINTEGLPAHMDRSMDQTDNIYANVDYSK